MIRNFAFWLGVLLASAGVQATFGLPTGALYGAWRWGAIAAAVVAFWWYTRSSDGRSWHTRCLDTTAVTALALGFAAAVHALVAAAAVRQMTLPLLGQIAGTAASWFCPAGAGPDGSLLLEGRSGTLAFAPSVIKLGPLLLTVCCAGASMAMLSSERRARTALLVLAISAAVVVWRFVAEAVAFGDLPNVLGSPTGWLLVFSDPFRQAAWVLALAGILAAAGVPGPPPAPTDGRSAVRWIAPVAAFGAVAAIGLEARLPGHPFGGRVVIDDMHSGYWGIAGRRMSKTWFGDFSTYNLSAATEYLGHYCDVRVNRSRRYDDGYLADVDVLILKTPIDDFTRSEEEAILGFVARGGGLFLIGDHTNLLGMSSRMNRFATLAGIGFVFDSVNDDLRGGFSRSLDTSASGHPVTAGLGPMEFMTGCSLKAGPRVEPLCVSWAQCRTLGDYAASSYFGSLRNDPRTDIGPVAHAAVGRLGDGTVLAYSDSTCLSSFGLFLHDRAEFLKRAVQYAGSAPLAWRDSWGILLLLAGVVGGLAGFVRCAGCPRWWLAALVMSFAAGLFGGQLVVRGLHRTYWPDLDPVRQPPSVSYLVDNTEAVLLPTLGANDPGWVEHSYDTFFASLSRLGLAPRLVRTPAQLQPGEVLIALNPTRQLTTAEHAALVEAVRAGATLVLGTRSDRVRADVLHTFLEASGLRLKEVAENRVEVVGAAASEALASGRVTAYMGACGAGRMVLIVGTEWFARTKMGHAFNVPDEGRRELFDAEYAILERLAGVDVGDRRLYRID